ncbi:hypothetical protein EWK14_21555 [Salmonella enterica subsp. enterica serovar Stanley]|nr:hypothetical protein [Salmonella enterica subsp. enterica serovar Stanley]
MQTINTNYHNGKIIARSWNGWTRSEYDAELSSEQNHRAAAEKLIIKLNKGRSMEWGIVNSAPSVPGVRGKDNGWTFIIGYVPEVAPLDMSITVKFCPATNKGPAFMRAYSWLVPRGIKVNYSPRVADGSDIQANARYAAGIMLDRINEICREGGDLLGWKIADYVQLYDGDRLFTLKAN